MKKLFSILLFAQLTFAAVVNYTYDTAGRLTKVDYGPSGNVTYTYDKAGNILSRVVAAGSTAAAITAVKVAWGGTTISSNAWLEIHGNNLVPANTPAEGVIWSTAPEFAQGKMPTKIGDVSVTINGKPAYIYFYCSAVTSACATDQINVLAPAAPLSGSVPVVVTTSAGSTAPFSAPTAAASPSFLFFTPAGNIIAQHTDYSLAGPATLYPGATTPAKAGETLLVYTVGFGLPTSTITEGSSSQSGQLGSPTTCTVGTSQTTPIMTLISPGLYQMNLTIPLDVKPGDNQLLCTYNGVTTQPGAVVSVKP
ncbi:MAG: hypothetical protein ABI824_12110 [Acidobacteriota bacterium]